MGFIFVYFFWLLLPSCFIHLSIYLFFTMNTALVKQWSDCFPYWLDRAEHCLLDRLWSLVWKNYVIIRFWYQLSLRLVTFCSISPKRVEWRKLVRKWTVIQLNIPEEAVCVPLCANALGKVIHPFILPLTPTAVTTPLPLTSWLGL